MAHLSAHPRSALILILLAISGYAFAGVVINEVLYDYPGTDTGYEWIELYNPGAASINLQGAKILKGGESFAEVFVFPYFMLRPGAFVLVAEQNVPGAQFYATLAFQNGGSETDAIRYISADGLYTDTVLYDNPNTNNLPDDSGSPGASFAEDAPEGHSLARIMDGYDTNDCAADFRTDSTPTAGTPNHVAADYALLWPATMNDNGNWSLELYIKNLSPLPKLESSYLDTYLDGEHAYHSILGGILAGDSIFVDVPLPILDTQNHLVEAFLTASDDPDTTNNHLALDIVQESLWPPVINEIMYDPATGYQEWIELWVENSSSRGSFSIQDASGNQFSFTLPAAAGYFVLCRYPTELSTQFPSCPAASIIQVSSWASMNNTGDSVYLLDSEGEVLNSMSYAEGATPRGVSLERYDTGTGGWGWRQSIDPSGATPGMANSAPPTTPPDHDSPVAVFGSPCKPKNGESISISYRLTAPAHKVDCIVYSRSGTRVRVLARNQSIGQTGLLVWDGRDDSGRYVSRGLYHILWESVPSSGGKLLSKTFTAVIGD